MNEILTGKEDSGRYRDGSKIVPALNLGTDVLEIKLINNDTTRLQVTNSFRKEKYLIGVHRGGSILEFIFMVIDVIFIYWLVSSTSMEVS